MSHISFPAISIAPGSTPQPTPIKTRANWTPQKDDTLLALILEQVHLGEKTDNGNIKKEAWATVVQEFNASMKEDYNKAQLASRYDVVSTQYETEPFSTGNYKRSCIDIKSI
jgi:hypothetical protein